MDNMKELNMNEMNNVVGGSGGSARPLPAKSGCIVYQIVRGDTLGKIARRYGTTAERIKAVNTTIHNLNDITAGYYIYIPV
jgi:bacteriocin-like protein